MHRGRCACKDLLTFHPCFPSFFSSSCKQTSFMYKNHECAHAELPFFLIIFSGGMIAELRGCSLALQYPCLGQRSLSYHIISLNPRICGEIRSEDTKTSPALSPSSYPLSLNLLHLLLPLFFPSTLSINNYPWCFRWHCGRAGAPWR